MCLVSLRLRREQNEWHLLPSQSTPTDSIYFHLAPRKACSHWTLGRQCEDLHQSLHSACWWPTWEKEWKSSAPVFRLEGMYPVRSKARRTHSIFFVRRAKNVRRLPSSGKSSQASTILEQDTLVWAVCLLPSCIFSQDSIRDTGGDSNCTSTTKNGVEM